MNKKELSDFLEAYDFIEDMSGKTIVNLIKTTAIMRAVYDELFQKHSISEPKFLVLLLLSQEPEGMPFSEIGRKLLVSRANMTGLIERMMKEGLVEKILNPSDKRSTKALLTQKGRKLFEGVKDDHIEFSRRMTAGIGDDEKELLSKLLKKLQNDIVDSFE
ncbi:putative multiple antibiotic resistance protein MarR [Peptoclostridium acidaminophilum DSM 3953]|uniref:Putative multiple antibiotic resistance protein MarR n=1 Tax=Peptoclostridium acidaminophilum DSM 3953 TaxID=1286171 RepID=W8T1S5_PEPAC|nr:MarR family transcriptional regulator [Peptoclostridium acidaminophilum]AHM55669.1 putative multiple antibiotic resistance protein MarR [Peptoclostridium acidaminophilum DSM 3953]